MSIFSKILGMVMLVTMVLTACAPATTPPPPPATQPPATQAPTQAATEASTATEAATQAATTATEAPTASAATCPTGKFDFGKVTGGPAGGFLEKALNGEYKGKTVTVDGTQTNPDDQKMKCGWKAFEDATGITVNYIGNKEFEARISIAVDAGQAPDIADFPQPGGLANFVKQGKIIDVSTFIPKDYLTQTYNQSWLDMATMQGPKGPITAGVWNRSFAKSLVWYSKKAFDASGYKVPQTWDDMLKLSDQIVKDGGTPWCIGIGSQAATGWPFTDWVEDVMLRTTTLQNYDNWVKGTLKFESPEVKNAFQTVGNLWFKDGYVAGGRASIATTFFGDAPAGLFTDPPKCFLHRQANFITSFFPQTAKPNVDYGVFYLPPIDPKYGKPFLVSADIYAMFNDRPEVRALMEYFTLPMSVSGFLNTSGAFALQNTAKPEMYTSEMDSSIAQLLASASAFRFDGSDQMPAEVGSGSFWKGATDYVSGSADLDTVLKEIDASWPKK